MWEKIRNGILSLPVQGIVFSIIVVVGMAEIGYLTSHKGDSASSSGSCTGQVQIGAVSVEKDPAGDSGAWLRFDYRTTADKALNCQYTITFYGSRKEAIRTITGVEDTFQIPSGEIYNGYSSTLYQEGMTARVTIP